MGDNEEWTRTQSSIFLAPLSFSGLLGSSCRAHLHFSTQIGMMIRREFAFHALL